MKQRAKIFYGILAVFALVLGACPTDSGTSPDKLNLSGQVYVQITDPVALLAKYKNVKYEDNLKISDGDQGGKGEINKGQLKYTIGVPLNLSPINEDGGLDYLKEIYSSLEFSSEDVKAAVVYLGIDSEEYSNLLKGLLDINLDYSMRTIKITIDTVNYVYVDKDLNITAEPDTFNNNDFDFPISLTTEKIDLKLKKGWNSLYSKITAQSKIPPEMILIKGQALSDPDSLRPYLTALEPTGHLVMSVGGDPDNLNWTLVPSQP